MFLPERGSTCEGEGQWSLQGKWGQVKGWGMGSSHAGVIARGISIYTSWKYKYEQKLDNILEKKNMTIVYKVQ